MQDKIYGNRRGEVIDNKDPLNAGRCKIYVFGLYDGVQIDSIPWALYSDPFMGGNSDVGGMFIPDEGDHVWVFFEEGDPEQPVYFAGAPAMNDGPQEAKSSSGYPSNRVFKTKSGHTLEFDDTDGDTRIRIAHKSGSQKIWTEDGDVEEVVEGGLQIFVEDDAALHVKGNAFMKVDGDCSRTVDGNVTDNVSGTYKLNVGGDYKTSTAGRRSDLSGGGAEYLSTGQVDVSGAMVALNRKKGAAIEVVNGEFLFAPQYAYSYMAARDLVEAAGTNAPFDTPEEQDLKEQSTAGGGFPEESEGTETGDEVMVTDEEIEALPAECPTLSENIYDTPIGNNGLTVHSISTGAYFKHQLQAQNGFSVPELICNAHFLCVNALDKILGKFSGLRINSGFRRGTTRSQHGRFMAADLQFYSGGSAAKYKEVLEFIAKNIDYDQCIIETSNNRTYWLHISYDRHKSKQRKQRLTYRNKKYTSGWNI